MSFKGFNWLKDGILPLSIAIMIACWLSPWMMWVRSWTFLAYERPIFSPLSMVAILIASAFPTKMLLKQEWPLKRIQTVIAASGLAVILFFIRLEYYGAFSVLDPAGWEACLRH